MSRPVRRLLPLLCAAALAAAPAFAQDIALTSAQVPVPADTAYPGTVSIHVDATDLARRIVRVREEIPAQAGRLTLLYPQWLPGNHGPSGPLDKIAGLAFTANGQKLAWTRDPLNVFAFHVDVPQGATSVTAEYQYLTPTDPAQGRIVMTPNMMNLQWNALVLYPAGHYASRIDTSASVRYPAGFGAATALDVAETKGDTVTYRNVPLDILVDSPIYAGRYGKVIDLAPGAKVPVRLNIFADAPKYLEAKPEQIDAHRRLYQQAMKLYGGQHYDHYDFLFSLSDQLGGNGLEHQRSSEDGEDTGYFTDYDPKAGFSDLLAHEYTHSWNGKYRRPADLWTPNYNVPMQDSLLWVYEGQTQYWGNVLTGRSGLRSKQAAFDALALTAATYADNRPGLAWRAVQDTTNDPIIASRRPKSYRNYQLSEDYYSAGQMIWLEADARIRAKTGGKKSLDDFARAFFGVNDGEWKVQNTYTFDDVVKTLDGVVHDDWATFLRDRLDGKVPLTGGLEASGWKLVYKDEPNGVAKAAAKGGGADFVYSLGLSIGKDGKVSDVRWDSPAFNAGIGSGMTIVAVNDREYSKDVLSDAVKAAKDDKAPIRLMVKSFDRYQTIPVDYHGGLRYPHLERIAGKPDLLTSIYAPR
ncbi:M61 family peptidase [Lysobacter sp. TY2-98]|uniref:M61 family metallopeptidase n=1 Tax=Lysobacter sp. TY2-98 TaxID=2290922 RepID=UPI000E200B74|nr:M61 family metallopeptidase [Lysobacter sp. TY2-98]AXK72777.1 M61 family peptidase [Lysobacter sp. TY2-98]